MNSLCNDTQRAILEGNALTPELAAHLESCPSCTNAKRFHDKALKTKIPCPDVPANLDIFINAAAKHNLAKTAAARRMRQFIAWGISSAACAVIGLTIFFAPGSDSKKNTIAHNTDNAAHTYTLTQTNFTLPEVIELEAELAIFTMQLEADEESLFEDDSSAKYLAQMESGFGYFKY